MRLLYCLLCCFLGITGLMAQSDSTSSRLDLKELSERDLLPTPAKKKAEVVTATRSGGRSLEEFPITVYIIPKEEIRMNGYVTLADALKSVPGIRVSQPGNGSDGETFMMYGLPGNGYAKILLNNIPIQPSVSRSLSIGEQLPIAQAEKIEIIYGPMANLYGSDAMAGVINIITEEVDQGNLTQVNVVGGKDGYRHANFMIGGKVGRNKHVVSYSMYGNYGTRDDMTLQGHKSALNTFDHTFYHNGPLAGLFADSELEALRNAPAEVVEEIPEVYRENGFPGYKGEAFVPEIGAYPQKSYLLGMTLNYKDLKLGFHEMYRQDHSSIGLNPVLFSHADPTHFIGEKVQRVSLSYSHDWEKLSLTLNSSLLRYRLNPESSWGNNYFNGHGFRSYLYQASDDIFAEGLLTYSPSPNWDWLIGVSVQRSSNLPQTNDLGSPFDPNDYTPFTENRPEPHPLYGNFGINPVTYPSTSAFLQGFYHKKRWSILFGARVINSVQYQSVSTDSVSNSALTFGDLTNSILPRFGALYKLTPASSLRFSFSSGFRLPPSNLVFNSLALPDLTFITGEIIPNSINYQIIPNEDLQPEASNYLEIGYRHLFSEDLYVDLGLFNIVTFNRINSRLTPIDTSEYPRAGINHINPDGSFGRRARQWYNDPSRFSSLGGLQFTFHARNLFEQYQVGIDAFARLAMGSEILPDAQESQIEEYRGAPKGLFQLNLSARPIKSLYIRLEGLAATRWLRRGILSKQDMQGPYAYSDGYFTLDGIVRYQLGKHLQVFAKARNALNTAYSGIGADGQDVDIFTNPQLGRNIQIGITFNR